MRIAWPRVRRMIVTAGLGAVTTLGVAWGLACADIPGQVVSSGQTIRPQRGEVGEADTKANSLTGRLYKATGRMSVRIACFGPDWPQLVGNRLTGSSERASTVAPDDLAPWGIREIAAPWLVNRGTEWPRGADSDWREVEASGWPMLALATVKGRAASFGRERKWGIELPGRDRKFGDSLFTFGSHKRALPLRPLWVGVVVNTAVFTGAWWVVMTMIGAVRARRRRWQGMCVGCGYDLRGLNAVAACPECGRGSVRG